MSLIPDTRASLIGRLIDAGDARAWDEFVSLYSPVILRMARRRGLQEADAQELCQEVLLRVSQAVERWTPDPSRGRFRDWILRIARNLLVNFLSRPRHARLGSGDSEIHRWLEQQPAKEEWSDEWDWEWRRQVFISAAQQVRRTVSPPTWLAFWKTSVEQASVSQTAQELQMSVGAVYVARSRVMAKLQMAVQAWREEQP